MRQNRLVLFSLSLALMSCATPVTTHIEPPPPPLKPQNTVLNGDVKLDFIPYEDRLYCEESGIGYPKGPTGVYSVEALGCPDGVFDKNRKIMCVDELAFWIQRDRRYSPGTTVYLFSCETGKETFAQELSNKLRCTVVAPTEKLWVHEGCWYEVAKSTSAFYFTARKPDLTHPGVMKVFNPQ